MELATTGNNSRSKIHSLKFALWVGLAGIVMMFAALTSAYMVRQAQGNWLDFRLPDVFFASTAAILISSFTIHFSYRSFKTGNELLYKLLLVATLILGIVFIGLQYEGWVQMTHSGVTLNGNPSGSFVYVLSGLHIVHVLGGIAALITALIYAFSLKYKVTPRRQLRFELVVHYWHFVDLLWIYLFIFFLLQR